MPDRINTLLRWLARIVCFPCVMIWLLVRLYVPWEKVLSPDELQALALLITLVLFLLAECFHLPGRLLRPWQAPWKVALAAIPALLLGGFFDISLSMLDGKPPVVGDLPVEELCHAGNAIVFAVIVLALLHAGRVLLDLAKVDWRQILIIFVCLNAVTAFYAFTSLTVYVWDNAGYWMIARTLAEEPLGYEHLLAILETTLTLDYNHLLALPISLVMRLFGGSRTVFLFCVSNFYTLPALWGLVALAKQRKWSGLVLVGLFPLIGYTGLVGFVDVACCGMGIWAYLIYTSDKPADSRGIFAGALLVFTFLCRRYFFFFAASFGVAALVSKLLFSRKQWTDFLALFCSCALCSLTFAYRFLLDKVLESDYVDLYSAYNLGLQSDLILFCRYFGLVLLSLILVTTLVCLAQKEARHNLAMGLVQLLVCFLAFVGVQSHGQQHLLLYIPALAYLSITSLSVAPQFLSALLSISMAVNCFIPRTQTVTIDNSISLFPAFQFHGPRRSDSEQLLALLDYVDSFSVREQKTATVLASSFTFNSETLSALRASLNLPEPEVQTVIQYHGTVDKRDAFNWNTAFADYLIVGDPVQLHLGEENQQVMALLAQHVLDGTGPGRAYTQLPRTFQLSDGVTVRIYRRHRPWYIEEYHDISDALIERYPDYAELYKIPRWIK